MPKAYKPRTSEEKKDIEDQRRRKVKLVGRQSENIEDLRDKPQGPKGQLRPTKAKKGVETKSRLIKEALSSKTTTNKNLENLPSTEITYMRNRLQNNRRSGAFGDRLGLNLKNKKLNSTPTSFVKDKKKRS